MLTKIKTMTRDEAYKCRDQLKSLYYNTTAFSTVSGTLKCISSYNSVFTLSGITNKTVFCQGHLVELTIAVALLYSNAKDWEVTFYVPKTMVKKAKKIASRMVSNGVTYVIKTYTPFFGHYPCQDRNGKFFVDDLGFQFIQEAPGRREVKEVKEYGIWDREFPVFTWLDFTGKVGEISNAVKVIESLDMIKWCSQILLKIPNFAISDEILEEIESVDSERIKIYQATSIPKTKHDMYIVNNAYSYNLLGVVRNPVAINMFSQKLVNLRKDEKYLIPYSKNIFEGE